CISLSNYFSHSFILPPAVDFQFTHHFSIFYKKGALVQIGDRAYMVWNDSYLIPDFNLPAERFIINDRMFIEHTVDVHTLELSNQTKAVRRGDTLRASLHRNTFRTDISNHTRVSRFADDGRKHRRRTGIEITDDIRLASVHENVRPGPDFSHAVRNIESEYKGRRRTDTDCIHFKPRLRCHARKADCSPCGFFIEIFHFICCFCLVCMTVMGEYSPEFHIPAMFYRLEQRAVILFLYDPGTLLAHFDLNQHLCLFGCPFQDTLNFIHLKNRIDAERNIDGSSKCAYF